MSASFFFKKAFFKMRIERLKKRPDFIAAHKQGDKWVTPVLVVQLRQRKDVEHFSSNALRVGFTASKKVGNAVARNRVKRRMRAVASDLLSNYEAKGCDIVLIGRRTTRLCDFEDISKNLKWALKKLGLKKIEPEI